MSFLPRGDYKNDIRPKKGVYFNKPLVAWAAVEDCDPSRCRILHLCHYAKTSDVKVYKCGLQREYINATAAMIHSCYAIQIKRNEQVLFRIGMHLIPLYKTLCKLKMEELATTHPVYTTTRGDQKAQPIYKEIRETIKTITVVWKDLGLPAPDDFVDIPTEPSQRGDKGYEDELFEEEPEEGTAEPGRPSP